MKIFLLSLTILINVQSIFAQTEENDFPVSETEQPLRYFGHLEFNGLLPLRNTGAPNHLAFETNYWLNQSPTLKSSLGFGWQMGFNEGYADNNIRYSINDIAGSELAYLYNYLSVRYKHLQNQQRIRPYAEVGTGWLLITDKFVDRPLNPDYDPNHTCDDGPSEYLRNTTLIKAQNRLALDAEVGLNVQVSHKMSLNLGVGGILTKPVEYLESVYQPSLIETKGLPAQSYQFRQRALHSTSLKIGIALLLFNDPNIIHKASDDNCFLIDTFEDSSSCN